MNCKILSLISILILLTSCKEYWLSRELERFMGQAIAIPENLTVISDRNIISLSDFEKETNALVILYDSLECSSCQIGHLYDYLWSYEKLDSIQGCQLMTIFSPRQEEYDEVVKQLMILNFPYPIYVDMSGSFRKINKCIPDDRSFHSFLIDKNGKPVFVGNPMSGPRMMELFMEAVSNLEANGGVYVEPEKR